MDKIKVGIVNVTGYAGIELARLLLKHPDVELVSGTGRSAAGQRLADVFPHLTGVAELTVESELGNVDFAFVAMPHRESALEVMKLMERGIKVVDISADFRLSNPDDYNEWYGFTHPSPEFLDKAVYGLPSYTGRISHRLIWLPIRAVIPPAPFWRWLVVKNGIIERISSSTASRAYRARKDAGAGQPLLGSQRNTSAYALKGHRHLRKSCRNLLISAAKR